MQTNEVQTKQQIDVYLDGVNLSYETWKFPGGEIGVKFTEESVGLIKNSSYTEGVEIHHHSKLWSSDDYFIIANLFDAVNRKVNQRLTRTLTFEYLPFARQDRVCHNGESFALMVFLKSLLAIGIGKLRTSDLHNEAPVREFCNNQDIDFYNLPQVSAFCFTEAYSENYSFIISPDAGAVEKAKLIKRNTPHIFLSKTRVDRRVVYEDFTDVELSGKVLVVDDIADGMNTFFALAEMLKRNHPKIKSIDLYVTHGIFSNNALDKAVNYHKIYCYNLMNQSLKQHEKLG